MIPARVVSKYYEVWNTRKHVKVRTFINYTELRGYAKALILMGLDDDNIRFYNDNMNDITDYVYSDIAHGN
jgi:hypothetical protein